MVPDPDLPSNVVSLAVPDPGGERAERARRNGARSRGPATAAGKARSARNALKHGLTARHGVVLDGEDEPAFQAMAGRLLGDLAPAGELASFLAGDLAAAMWRTGRARRLERQAFAGDVPDPDKLNLALRYGGSASRELYRALRALDRLGRRPGASADRAKENTAAPPCRSQYDSAAGAPSAVPDRAPDITAAPIPGIPGQPDDVRPMAEPPMALPTVAALAWGAGGPPPPPPGCLLLRPVPHQWSRLWHRHQADAFPGAEPVAVAADGAIHALDAGAWVLQPPHLPPGARPLTAPNAASEQAFTAATSAKLPTVPTPAVSVAHRPAPGSGFGGWTSRHGMTLASLAGTDTAPSHQPSPPAATEETPRKSTPVRAEESLRRNEPSQPVDSQRYGSVTGTNLSPVVAPDPAIALDPWSRMWGLTPPPEGLTGRAAPPTPPCRQIASATVADPPVGSPAVAPPPTDPTESPAFMPPAPDIARDLADPPPAGAADVPTGEPLPRSARHRGRRHRTHRRRGAARSGPPLAGLDAAATEADR